ncbi:DNA polymerase II large subunit [Candidatus Nitrosopelagicus sp.]|nr:DNA polymerase II large subunit [Candidatus Nitrosopelagicus sp.]
MSTTANYLKEIKIPQNYSDYYEELSQQVYKEFETAADAKSTLLDSSGIIEPKIAFDLAERVAKMHDIDISTPLRELLDKTGKENAALIMSKEIALGKYQSSDASLEDKLDHAVRVGLAIVTEGVTIAPLQGISEIKIKNNKDGSQYLSVSIAGPMRSAGGTESAVTMLIADHVRRAVGLEKYQADCFDDETGRFVEELRIYESEAKQSFQFHVSDDDIKTVISNLPVELEGEGTDPDEVVNHRNMTRIKTDRVRGGALRVLNDGLIGRSKKLLKRIEKYNLEGWEWLNDVQGAVQKGESGDDASEKRMREVITGRSVLSMPNKIGGFRLRYGRACNTGFASVGLHPVIAEILDHTIAVGTQIKLDKPSKGATVAFVDSLETPIVRLKGGEVVKIQDTEHGIQIKNDIEKILHLGDILITFGDFLENNAELIPTPMVEEVWTEYLKAKLSKHDERLEFLTKTPTFVDAILLSKELKIPLHPKFLYYWDFITTKELEKISNPILKSENEIHYEISTKQILENLGIPHKVADDKIIISGIDVQILNHLIFGTTLNFDTTKSVLELLTETTGIEIKNKFSKSIGVRIGRPEKAAPRLMKPPVHVLFPVAEKGGITRDILKAAVASESFFTNLNNRRCTNCNIPSIGIVCSKCGNKTTKFYICRICKDELETQHCEKCKRDANGFSYKQFPLKQNLMAAQEKLGIRAKAPFKGVDKLINQEKIPEPLEKGLIRQKFGLSAFKDGTVRFDATNSPLTHFKLSWIGTTVEQITKLGYENDIDGNPITNDEQLIELKMQDVIIPLESAEYLVNVSKYIDFELQKFFGKQPFYNLKNTRDLLGHLVIGLAPHTSVGITGRLIGYTKTHVCFASPIWHSAKRRDADGDADSVMLLLDALLNFSRQFLSDKIGGLMDAPLLIQPIVLPHEAQTQAHNFEVAKEFPLEFYESSLNNEKSGDIRNIETLAMRKDTGDENIFYDYFFTHNTTTLTTSKSRSAYSTLESMVDKLDLQIRNADIINAVETRDIVSYLIQTHLIPDIMGNIRAYAKQKFRCTACGAKYRRMPLLQKCTCGHKLLQTITRPSIEKYLPLAKKLVTKYDVDPYLKGRIMTLSDEIELLFGKGDGSQQLLTDFVN